MGKLIDLNGKVFGRLTVIGLAEYKRKPKWLCKCECGNLKVTTSRRLIKGLTKSCGCLFEETRMGMLKHGMVNTVEYRAWQNMLNRCYYEKHKSFKNWGGRGIKVCKRWRDSFEKFYLDMGARPSKEHSLDRIDNDGNYKKSNCRWATKEQQMKNRRKYKNSSSLILG